LFTHAVSVAYHSKTAPMLALEEILGCQLRFLGSMAAAATTPST
jgi:hypothetical protein